MADDRVMTYEKLPLFREAAWEFQKGNWESGLTRLQELEEAFPLETDLRAWRQEMLLRSKMDEIESEDEQRQKKAFWTKLLLQLGAAAVVIVLVVFGLRASSRMIQAKWYATREQMQEEVLALEQAAEFRNGQNLLLANRPEEAMIYFQKVAEVNPDYPQLAEFMSQAQTMINLENTYQEALRLEAEGNITGALERLQNIASRDARYKDVALKVQNLQSALSLEDQFAQASAAYGNELWSEAVAGFEAVRATDRAFRQTDVENLLYQSYLNAAEARLTEQEPTFESLQVADEYYRKALALKPQNKEISNRQASARSAVEEYLVNSYMNSALQALTGQEDSLAALQIAEDNFSQALVLRPDDLQVIKQVELSRRFISGVENFNRGLWSQAIADLEAVYVEDPNYAGGTARQTLYEAYVARGKNGIASTRYLGALDDFQQAAILAQDAPDSALRLYEAQTMVAYAQGLLGNYQDAALIYKVAVDESGLRTLDLFSTSEMAKQIVTADSAYTAGNYERAYNLYRQALELGTDVYDRTTYVVQKGEYITQLARKYNSTVEAILDANGLTDASKVTENRVLVIPSLPSATNP